jgi:hypothetical protein
MTQYQISTIRSNNKKDKDRHKICSTHYLSPESYEVCYRQVFWLILFWLPSHFTKSVTVAGYAKTFIGFTAAGTAPVFHGIPFSLQSGKI